MKENLSLSIEELARQVGVPIRTVRFYISEGLLPGPGARGRAASYGREHLIRLSLIRALVDRHVPLGEIREKLEGLTVAELQALFEEEERRSSRERKLSPKEYISSLLDRVRRPELQESAEPVTEHMMLPDTLSEPRPPAYAATPPEPHAPEAWRRWELLAGIELHVREDAYRRHRDLVERILRLAHDLRPRWRS